MDDALGIATLLEIQRGTGGDISAVQRLFNEFEAHEAKEEKSLEQYKKLAREMPSPATRFILHLIISDEEKHHAVFHAMLATLKSSLLWTQPEGSLEGADSAGMNVRLRATTEEFIRLEKAGIRHYQRLAEASRGYYHGVFALLLNSMIRDSEKHVQLLEFLRASLKDA